jgi:HTH-type transcriptional regulator/antitoxin HigA
MKWPNLQSLEGRIMSGARKSKKLGLRPFSKMPKTFAGLCRMLPPRPIHDETEYDNAIEMLDSLVGFDLNDDQLDYLEVLTGLVGAYEDKHHAIDTSHITGLDSLKYLLEQNNMTASDLGELLGNRSLGSKILRGERELSKNHLRILAKRFKVDAGLFL